MDCQLTDKQFHVRCDQLSHYFSTHEAEVDDGRILSLIKEKKPFTTLRQAKNSLEKRGISLSVLTIKQGATWCRQCYGVGMYDSQWNE